MSESSFVPCDEIVPLSKERERLVAHKKLVCVWHGFLFEVLAIDDVKLWQ